MENERTDTALDKILDLLKKELSLALRLYENAETQRRALKDNLNGMAVADATEAVNATLREMEACEKNKAAFLAEIGEKNLDDALGRLPYSKEKTRARQYMKRLEELMEKLKNLVETNRRLLAHDMEYLTFNLNVMTAASAAPGYGTPDAPASATQGRKLFDESI